MRKTSIRLYCNYIEMFIPLYLCNAFLTGSLQLITIVLNVQIYTYLCIDFQLRNVWTNEKYLCSVYNLVGVDVT